MLLISAVMLSTASFAWFSMNNTVQATGMQISANAVGSLVIEQNSAPAANSTTTTKAMTAATPRAMLDATHDATQITGDFTSGLKTVADSNRTTIPNDTGVYSGDAFAVVPADSTTYFVDYTVVIAARDAAVTGQDLVATLSNATGTVFANAVAVDYYIGSVAKANYKGTAHASGDTGVTIGENIAIPQANGTAGVTVIMRVYIDGAVSTVFTNNYDPSDITFGVSFVATAHS